MARDKLIHRELQNRSYLQADKITWLKYHDRNCEKLYDMLPLTIELSVMLVGHMDRSPDKQFLKGKVGIIHS